MNETYYPGVSLIIVGAIAWILGTYVIGAPLVVIGQILVVIGVIVLGLALLRGHL